MIYKIILIILFLVSIPFSQDSLSIDSYQTTKWRLIWYRNVPSDSVVHYTIYRNSMGQEITDEDSIAIVFDPDTVYIDSNIVVGVLYSYKLKAINIYGSSEFSEPAVGAIPEVTLPDSFIFDRDTIIVLDDYGNDLDSPVDSLNWTSEGGEKITVNITPEKIAQISIDSSAVEIFIFTIMDVDSFYSSKQVTITAEGEIIPSPPIIYIITK